MKQFIRPTSLLIAMAMCGTTALIEHEQLLAMKKSLMECVDDDDSATRLRAQRALAGPCRYVAF